MKNIKLLALDLDGTTLRSNNTLSSKVGSAIEDAIKSGIEVVVASGRPYKSMPKQVLEIKGINYAIASNGATIHDSTGKIIKSNLLSETDVLKFLEITKDYSLILDAFIDGATYGHSDYVKNPQNYSCPSSYINYVTSTHTPIDNMRGFIYEHRYELDSIAVICNDKNFREELKSKVQKSLENIYITSSTENFVELMHGSATKARSVKWLCDRLSIDIQNTSACGNADNDVDMIAQAGLGVAVKNASKSCYEVANINVASNDDDGVADLIEYILN